VQEVVVVSTPAASPRESATPIRVGISACLLGQEVRFDGGHKRDRYITDTLGKFFEWVPVCPEVEMGLGTPRETLRLVGDSEGPRFVFFKTDGDITDGMKAWAVPAWTRWPGRSSRATS